MSKNSSRGAAWESLRKQVLTRDNYQCNYCGNEATEADHVVAKKNGGKDELNNLVASCRRCNGSKQDKVENRNNWFNRNWLTKL